MQIKILEEEYDKTYFYSIMGKYFAEPRYKKEMPYLNNKESNIWFLAFNENDKLIGFGAIDIKKNKIVLESSYVEDECRNQRVWKKLVEARLDYVKKHKPIVIETVTKEEHVEKYFLNNGFNFYRKSGRYHYLQKKEE